MSQIAISEAAVKLEGSSKDLAILKGDLLSRQKELRETKERLGLLETRMCVLQSTKQEFFGFRIISSTQRIPVTLGLVEGCAGK